MMRQGFTLIELLIVMAIIALLAGMAMPMVSMAQRTAKQSNTQSIMRTVENGLGMFRVDVGIYPYHAHATTVDELEPNRLADKIAWVASDADRADQQTRLKKDLAALVRANAATTQAFDGTWKVPIWDGVTMAAIGTGAADLSTYPLLISTANRYANERARLAFLAGHTKITGAKDPTTILLPAPESQGWQEDYISQDLGARSISGSAILDAYGTPLLYVCKAIPSPRPVFLPDSVACGLRAPQNQQVSYVIGKHYGMAAITRSTTTLLASDVRTDAAAPYTATYELWSAGMDKTSAPIRNDALNHDDILTGPYRNGLN